MFWILGRLSVKFGIGSDFKVFVDGHAQNPVIGKLQPRGG